MTDCCIQGVIINSEDTAAAITAEVSSNNSGLAGMISGTVQFFENGNLNKFKFNSAAPASINTLKHNLYPKIEASFKNVTLTDVFNKTATANGSAFLTAVRMNTGTWSGSFAVTCPNGQSLRISGQFSGNIQLNGAVSYTKKRPGSIPVVIQLTKGSKLLRLGSTNLSKTLGCRIKYRYPMINAFSTRVSNETLGQLLANDAVKVIWRDRKVRAFLDISTPVVKAPPVWNLGFKGAGVGIAIIDTGIYPHPDLITPTNRIIAFKDYVNRKAKAYDDNGHGTHVAGDAAGNGISSNGRFRGPAPRANLIGIKVLDKYGEGSLSAVLAGIQFAVNNKKNFNVKVINLSLGAEAVQSYKNDPLCQAVEKAWQAGIIVCAAAGNSGPAAGTIDTPGIDPLVITVGADNTKRTVPITDDSIAGFSGRGPTIDGLTKPDVVAPGVNIISLRAPGSTLDTSYPGSRNGKWYFKLSGTSMATPITAGVAALIVQKNPGLGPAAVKKLLKSTARKIGSYPPNTQGSGLIDALAAVKTTI